MSGRQSLCQEFPKGGVLALVAFYTATCDSIAAIPRVVR